MDTESDRTTASRDVLIAIIVQHRAVIAELQVMIVRLERQGRGRAVVDEALGQSFSGALVSDCYAKDILRSPWHGLHSAAKKAKLRNTAYPVAVVASGILCETCHRAHSLA